MPSGNTVELFVSAFLFDYVDRDSNRQRICLTDLSDIFENFNHLRHDNNPFENLLLELRDSDDSFLSGEYRYLSRFKTIDRLNLFFNIRHCVSNSTEILFLHYSFDYLFFRLNLGLSCFDLDNLFVNDLLLDGILLVSVGCYYAVYWYLHHFVLSCYVVYYLLNFDNLDCLNRNLPLQFHSHDLWLLNPPLHNLFNESFNDRRLDCRLRNRHLNRHSHLLSHRSKFFIDDNLGF